MMREAVQKERTSWRYQHWRRRILAHEPLCRPCREAGFTVGAVEIDHVVPIARAPERFWDENNVQPICRACHEAKTAAENRHETPDQAAWQKRLEGLMT